MAITISRQDYSTDASGSYNGWEPNTISGALELTDIAAGGTDTIEADIKDHKTVFIIVASSATTVTFYAGDTDHGVNDLEVAVEAGTNMIWLDSARFVNKETGEITVGATAAVSIVGYEMR